MKFFRIILHEKMNPETDKTQTSKKEQLRKSWQKN